jgi:hypothetical protein
LLNSLFGIRKILKKIPSRSNERDVFANYCLEFVEQQLHLPQHDDLQRLIQLKTSAKMKPKINPFTKANTVIAPACDQVSTAFIVVMPSSIVGMPQHITYADQIRTRIAQVRPKDRPSEKGQRQGLPPLHFSHCISNLL